MPPSWAPPGALEPGDRETSGTGKPGSWDLRGRGAREPGGRGARDLWGPGVQGLLGSSQGARSWLGAGHRGLK